MKIIRTLRIKWYKALLQDIRDSEVVASKGSRIASLYFGFHYSPQKWLQELRRNEIETMRKIKELENYGNV